MTFSVKAPRLALPKLEMPRLGLAFFRRRILFRGVFLLLMLATVALALALLQEEKERSYRSYQQSFGKTQAEILARLRHPSGLLALQNPELQAQVPQGAGAKPLRPLLLPYGALDFDDQYKALQAVEMAACSVRYPDGSELCVAVGNNPYAGGFIYLVGAFDSGDLAPRPRGSLDLALTHRARVVLAMRGQTQSWIAPFELAADSAVGQGVRGRLTGFVETGPALDAQARPVRDFRGWLWQDGACAAGAAATASDCLRRSFYSIRLPVEAFREALFHKPRPIWPPPDLAQIAVQLQMLAPNEGQQAKVLFDSNSAGARQPPSLNELRDALLPGETLSIRKQGAAKHEAITLKGLQESDERISPWLTRLIGWLPVDLSAAPLSARSTLATPLGHYDIELHGDMRGVERNLSAVATRVSGFVGAMLSAIALAWLLIEVGLIRRITVLARRAAALSYNVQDGKVERGIGDLEVSDLRGKDELGTLAGGLADLLRRVKDDVQREHLRAQQERDMWHAVGHEIMSPLQSLMVLHGSSEDASHRYVKRMQQAVRVLYGHASPGEALQAAPIQAGLLDLNDFLRHVAENAGFAGIADVRFTPGPTSVPVRADEFSLEDVVTHILRNADRHRRPGTPISMSLQVIETSATVSIHNLGEPIAESLIDHIFDYGVSDSVGLDEAAGLSQDDASNPFGRPEPATAPSSAPRRGQGLFVAKTYMAKMGGAVQARNEPDGVTFTLSLQRQA